MASTVYTEPQRISITICGDGGCGKSSITLRLVRSQWTSEYDPTIEDSYSVSRTIDGVHAYLSLTDTAGQEEYRGLISSASLASDAFLLVYDITNPSSLYDQLPYFLELVQQERETRAEGVRINADNPFGAVDPIVIVAGNKCDLKDERQISARDGLEWARAHGCGFMETSARDCVNVEETFALIVRRVREARDQYLYIQNGGHPRGHMHGMSGVSGHGGDISYASNQQSFGIEDEKNMPPSGWTTKSRPAVLTRDFWRSGRWWRWAKC